MIPAEEKLMPTELLTSRDRGAQTLAVSDPSALIYGRAPKPVSAGRGLVIGGGTVIPEINFTLPPIDIDEHNWPDIRGQYEQLIRDVCQRAVELEVPGLLVEFKSLPPMTVRPQWGVEITEILAAELRRVYHVHGLPNALRLTPNDSRNHERPPRMRSGPYWDGMTELFARAEAAGADMISLESTGGKEISDNALMNADLRTLVFALGVLAPRDMEFVWRRIVSVCGAGDMVPAGDTACGCANTAMVLAEQRLLPRVFAAIVRVACVPRSLVAYEAGARGPSKDCAYEGPYMKAIAGVPISMEGRSAACAHLSPVGNVAQALCDCWSNESVQNVRLLSASAPVVSMEQLAYDCRLLNTASKTPGGALQMRDWLVESDSYLDPQAHVLRPDVVIRLSTAIMAESTPYARTRRAVLATIGELRHARSDGRVHIAPSEVRWLDRLGCQAEALPEDETAFIAEMRESLRDAHYRAEEYGLE